MRDEVRIRDDDRFRERVRIRRDARGFRGLDRNNDGVISSAEFLRGRHRH